MIEAQYYIQEKKGRVRCTLCPHECLVADGKYGICKVRFNRNGKLYTDVYSGIAAMNVDPVEKKPLYHFYPGKQILSIGTAGCNMHCLFCQNDSLSQHGTDYRHSYSIKPEKLISRALSIPENIGIAYTYNEPFVFYELMTECTKLAHNAGLKNVAVTNGFINPAPLLEILPLIDAFNVDLKAFSDSFYRRQTGSRLQPVLESLQMIAEAGKHIEITTLIIPTLNDSPDEFESMIKWIAGNLGKQIPLHLSRYFPAYRMSIPPTPIETLERFYDIAKSYLDYVYPGNITANARSATYCPECGSTLITRTRYKTGIKKLTSAGRCSECGKDIYIKI